MLREIAQMLGEALPDPLVVAETDGRVAFVNPPGTDAFGLSESDLGALTLAELLPGLAAATTGNGDSGTVCLVARRRDGTEFPAQASYGAATLDGRRVSFAIVRDLTQEREAQRELRRTRDQLAEAQTLARVGSWEWDIPANRVTWSDELYRIYGLRPGEVEPSYEGFLERVHPDDRESVDARNHKAFADHQPFEDIKRCLRPDGAQFLMRTQGRVVTDDAGNPVRMLGVCEDVTAEIEAARMQAELAAIVESSQDAIVARTLDGEITSWSPGAESLYGYRADEAIGKPIDILIPPDRRTEDAAHVVSLVRGESMDHYETRMLRKDGSLIDVSLGMSPVHDANGKLAAISTIARDITERKRFEAQLKRLADQDPLTGLLNRRRFEEELSHQVASAQRYGGGGAVLMLDLDNFKYINDVLGHHAGDEFLQSVARLLKRRLRETDMLARLGGDEFAVLLPSGGDDVARTVSTGLLEALREHAIAIDGRPVSATASIGYVCFGGSADTAESLLTDADRAMYLAKDGGRDRVATLPRGNRGAVGSGTRVSWEHRIKEAFSNDRFVLHSQPIINLRTGEVDQHELLLRMHHGDDLIPPGAFLGIAERLGLVHAIDGWVIAEAIRMLAARPGLRCGVNLSARSIDDELVLGQMRDGLRENAIDPSRLVIEITETAAIGNVDVARRFAQQLHDLGCPLALDDFGTGFGSFYYLKHLPADYLKIDGDFVASPRSHTDELVIDAIVGIAKGLGKRTIAEHVEDEHTLDVLREMGVDYAQGFHVGRPQPVADAGVLSLS